MHAQPLLLSPHRRARFIALARLALLWIAAALFGALKPNRRHIKQRYGWLGLDGLVRTVCTLAIIRAVELAHLPRHAKPQNTRDFAQPGFQRQLRPQSLRRAAIGAHLRRWFSSADPGLRIQRLLEALADLDAFVRKHVLKRARRRLTKLRPLIAVRPPAQDYVSAPSRAPQAADSS